MVLPSSLWTSSARGAHAKTCPSPATVPALLEKGAVFLSSPSKSSAPCGKPQAGSSRAGLSGRMSLVLFRAIKDKTFEPCWSKSDKPAFQYLNLASGRKQGWLELKQPTSVGECSMLSIGESPSVARESSLSQILESRPEGVPEKYYLTARACAGILRRAENRGRPLPMPLKAALQRQASPLGTSRDDTSTTSAESPKHSQDATEEAGSAEA